MAQLNRQNKVIEKEGPYGDIEAIQNFSVQLEKNQRFSKLVVRHRYYVDAIGFAISGPNATPGISMFGGNGGNKTEIEFKEGEYITGISGQFGESYISKLKIHTNVNSHGYGPYEYNELCEGQFSSPKLASGDQIVGLFGSAEYHLVSLGLFVEKNSPNPKWVVKKCGPYGSQRPENYSFKLEEGESIKEVIIRHGCIVDAIGFVVAKPNGSTYNKVFGGNGEVNPRCGENITRISGTYGNYNYLGNN